MPSAGYSVTNAFASQSGNVPASQLDVNFNQAAAAANTLVNTGNFFIDSGAANAMVVTVPSPLVVAYAAGLPFQVQVAAPNTGATTLTVNSLGSINVVYPGSGAAMLSGQLTAGAIVSLMFDGTHFQYLGSIFGSGTFTGVLTSGGNTANEICNYMIDVNNAWLTLPFMTVTIVSGALFMTGVPAILAPSTNQAVFSLPFATTASAVTNNALGTMAPASTQINFWASPTAFALNSGGWTNATAIGASVPSLSASFGQTVRLSRF